MAKSGHPAKQTSTPTSPLGTPNQHYATALPKEPIRLVDKIGVAVAIVNMLILGGGLLGLLLNQ